MVMLNNQRLSFWGIIKMESGWGSIPVDPSSPGQPFHCCFVLRQKHIPKMFLSEIRLGRIEYVQMKFYTTVVWDAAISWTHALLITYLSVSQKCCGPKLVYVNSWYTNPTSVLDDSHIYSPTWPAACGLQHVDSSIFNVQNMSTNVVV